MTTSSTDKLLLGPSGQNSITPTCRSCDRFRFVACYSVFRDRAANSPLARVACGAWARWSFLRDCRLPVKVFFQELHSENRRPPCFSAVSLSGSRGL